MLPLLIESTVTTFSSQVLGACCLLKVSLWFVILISLKDFDTLAR